MNKKHKEKKQTKTEATPKDHANLYKSLDFLMGLKVRLYNLKSGQNCSPSSHG